MVGLSFEDLFSNTYCYLPPGALPMHTIVVGFGIKIEFVETCTTSAVTFSAVRRMPVQPAVGYLTHAISFPRHGGNDKTEKKGKTKTRPVSVFNVYAHTAHSYIIHELQLSGSLRRVGRARVDNNLLSRHAGRAGRVRRFAAKVQTTTDTGYLPTIIRL